MRRVRGEARRVGASLNAVPLKASDSKMKKSKGQQARTKWLTLKDVARRAECTASTVSAVLNNSRAASVISPETKARVLAAARELNYQPNFAARSLRMRRNYTVGVITEEIGDPYGGMVISGIESFLTSKQYFFAAVAHRHNHDLLHRYSQILLARGVEGLIAIDTSLWESFSVPTVAVAGHQPMKGVTNILLDHERAAELALSHLWELGHRHIAFLRGQPFSSDSEERWRSIRQVAKKLDVDIRLELVGELRNDDASPGEGYRVTKEVLSRGKQFTALFAYNDISALGAIRAIRDTGARVPEDVSVIGFDDIREAAYQVPSLTTIRQPLRTMGEIAARTLVDRIEGQEDYPSQIAIEPELIIRESTGICSR
jgi:DNA-binding LacI/PurR family transcriptional regulator